MLKVFRVFKRFFIGSQYNQLEKCKMHRNIYCRDQHRTNADFIQIGFSKIKAIKIIIVSIEDKSEVKP